jgi:hypothetical protein
MPNKPLKNDAPKAARVLAAALGIMNIYETERRVMRMLASLQGGYLGVEHYNLDIGKRLEKTNFPISVREFQSVVRALGEKGLVASVFERLDGSLVALTAEGRKLMEAEGFVFNVELVEKTRTLFKEWLCKAEM